MNITIIIPTFNEEENLKILIPALQSLFLSMGKFNFYLLIVDGNSRDGTVETVKSFQKQFSNIHLIEEEKKSGLGSAYIKGFKYAMSKIESDYVIEMDADLQHNPADLPKLINSISEGYDLVIGSRYVKGGSVPESWALYRKLLSRLGSLFASIILRIFSIRDFTSGFKLTKVRGFLDQINFDNLLSKGFAYKIDMLIRLYEMGAKVKEVPISFGLRDRGNSKMEKRNLQDSLRVVLKFAIKRNKNFLKFVVVGFGGLFVDFTFFNILWIVLRPYYEAFDSHFYFWYFSVLDPASFFSGLIAMVFTYLMNNFWSFNERKRTALYSILTFFIIYALFSSVPIFVRSYLVGTVVDIFGESFLIRNFGFFLGVAFGIIWNYLVYSRIIWKRKNA